VPGKVWVDRTGAQTGSVVEVFFPCRLSLSSGPVFSFLHPAPIRPCEQLEPERCPGAVSRKEEGLKETVGKEKRPPPLIRFE